MDVEPSMPVTQIYPAMRELLRQCIAQTHGDVSFVALADVAGKGPGNAFRIPVIYPVAERNARLITRWTRTGVYRALETGSTELLVGKIKLPGNDLQRTGLLIVAPMHTSNGAPWGAVALLKATSAVERETINVVEQCAHAVSSLLIKSDDPSTQGPSEAPAPHAHHYPIPQADFLLHELRVPLSAATYALEALMQRYSPGWEYDGERLLHIAQSGVIEAQSIVRSMNQWPTLGTDMVVPHMEAVSVDEIVERALNLLPAARYRVVQQLAPDLPPVRGNQSWLTQVLVNLLENALKYASAHREIEVSAHQLDGNYVLILVQSWDREPSHNPGYASQPDNPRVSPDSRTREGLGLNIARYFVTSMGGEIWMESDGPNGAGSCIVKLVLPILAASEHDAPQRTDQVWHNPS